MYALSKLNAVMAIAGLPLCFGAQMTVAQSSVAEYELFARLMPENILSAASEICAPAHPTPQLLQNSGYTLNADGVWENSVIRISFGDRLGAGPGHHCVVSALYPGGARPAGADKIFEEAMARAIAARFGSDPTSTLALNRTQSNYHFTLTDTATGDWQLDGVIIPPAPAVPAEVGGIMLNLP